MHPSCLRPLYLRISCRRPAALLRGLQSPLKQHLPRATPASPALQSFSTPPSWRQPGYSRATAWSQPGYSRVTAWSQPGSTTGLCRSPSPLQALGAGAARPHVPSQRRLGAFATSDHTMAEAGERQYWLLKSEPEEFSWADQTTKDGGVAKWDGVRNGAAQKNMRSMRLGDLCFFYHSGAKGREVVGIVAVCGLWEPEEGAAGENGKFGFVRVRAVMPTPKPVSLSAIKEQDGKSIKDFILLRQQRLSVVPVSAANWEAICDLGEVDREELSRKLLGATLEGGTDTVNGTSTGTASAAGMVTVAGHKGSGAAVDAEVKEAGGKAEKKGAASKGKTKAKAAAKTVGKVAAAADKRNGSGGAAGSRKRPSERGVKEEEAEEKGRASKGRKPKATAPKPKEEEAEEEEPASKGRRLKATAPKPKAEEPLTQGRKPSARASKANEEKPAARGRKSKASASSAKEEEAVQSQEAPRGRKRKGAQ